MIGKGMTNYIFVFDGIGAFDGAQSGVMRMAANRLRSSLLENGHDFQIEWVDWPASINPIGPLSWSHSTEIGVENFQRRVDNLKPGDKFVILAFSGGNRPAHVWLKRVAEWHPDVLNDVLAVGLASDPYRPHGKQQNGMPMPGGYGVCGEWDTPIMDRTFYVAIPGDAITDAVDNAMIRTAADVIDEFPGDILRGLVRIYENRNRGDFQLARKLKLFHENPLHWFMGLGPRLNQAKNDIVGYATGVHTSAYTRPFEDGDPAMIRFANTISWKVRNP